jgi:hypothetical protein
LKGRGFKPRRKCHQTNPALAAEAAPPIAMPLFQQTFQPLGFDISLDAIFPRLVERSRPVGSPLRYPITVVCSGLIL